MTVQEIITFARNTELKPLSASSYDDTTIITYINLGLLELHRRFNIKIGVEVMQTKPNIPVYNLRNADVLQILSVHNTRDELLQTQKHRDMDTYDIKFINHNTILLKRPKDEELVIIYKATAVFVKELADEVDIPPMLVEALLAYIGYKAHGAKDPGQENNIYFAKFNAVCKLLIDDGFGTEASLAVNSVPSKGFV